MTQGHVLNYIYSSFFVISRTWTQPKCPAIEKELKKVWYSYTMEYYTAEKQNEIVKFFEKYMELKTLFLVR